MINTTASLQSLSPPSRRVVEVVEVTTNQVILLNSPGLCPTLSTLEQRPGLLPSLPLSQDTLTIVQPSTTASTSLPTLTTPPPLTLLPITRDTETHKVLLVFSLLFCYCLTVCVTLFVLDKMHDLISCWKMKKSE